MADDNSADSSTDALVRWAATCVETFLESFAGMLQPSTSLEQRLERFVARSSAPGSTRRVVLITSGGTTVPLERNCVRSIDNFSSGTRGAWSCEEFLEKHEEYDVLFLTRGGSAQPFVSDFQEVLFSDDDRGDPTYLHACVEKVMAHCHGPRFLRVEFTTVFEYLHLVRLMSKHLKPLGSRVMVYLAAAVSDFYVPETRLPTNKIQSRPEDKFQIELEKTPKALGVVRHIWLPEAYVVSFKLETDETILIDKARAAVAAYNVDCVVANLLQTRKELVQLVRGVDEAPMLLRRDACVAGSRLETKLVATLVEFHSRPKDSRDETRHDQMGAYARLKVPELKEELKRRHLRVSGKKADLISRLEMDDEHAVGEHRGTKRKGDVERVVDKKAKVSDEEEDAVEVQGTSVGEQVLFCDLIRDELLKHFNPRKLSDIRHVLELRCFKGLLSDVDLKEVFFQKMAGYAEKDFLLANWRQMRLERMKQRVLDATLIPGPGHPQNDVCRRLMRSLRTKKAVMREFGVLAYVPWQVYSQMRLGTEVLTCLGTEEGVRLLRQTTSYIEGRTRAEVYLGYASLVSLDESVIVRLIEEFGACDLSRACRFAALNNHLSVIELLNERYHADVHLGCLHNAASAGYLELIDQLVDRFGVDPNNRHYKDGGTALHYAADQGNVETIRFLMDKYQVDAHVTDRYGDTALTVARRYKFDECAKLLRSYMGVTEEDDEPLNRMFPIGLPFPFPFPFGPPPPVGIEIDEGGVVLQCGVM